MKKIITLLLSIVITNLLQAQITFQKTYGTASSEKGVSCLQTTDGGFLSAGDSPEWGEIFMVKTDEQGNLLWAKEYLFSGATYGEVRHVMQSSDGGFLINGCVELTSINVDIYIIKTDSMGNLLWSKTFGGLTDDFSYQADETADGGFVIVGSSNFTCLLFKVDSNGNFKWSKLYYGAIEGFDVKQTADGGFCIASAMDDGIGINQDMLLIKTDNAGDFLWAQSYSAGDFEAACNVKQISDGGFIISGIEGNVYLSNYDVFLVRTDSLGNMVWAKSFGGPRWEYPAWVDQTSDGGFVSGGSWSYNNIPDYYLLKTDSSGTLQWSNRYGTSTSEYSFGSGQKTSDQGFVMTASTLMGFGTSDFLLIKTDSLGNSGCYQTVAPTIVATLSVQVFPQFLMTSTAGSIASAFPIVSSVGNDSVLCYNSPTGIYEASANNTSLSVYPNPFSNSTIISFSLLQSQNISLRVFDMNGRLISILADKIFDAGENEILWNADEVNAGIYFLQLQSSENVQTKKLILTK